MKRRFLFLKLILLVLLGGVLILLFHLSLWGENINNKPGFKNPGKKTTGEKPGQNRMAAGKIISGDGRHPSLKTSGPSSYGTDICVTCESLGNNIDPDIAVDSKGDIYLVYSKDTGSQIIIQIDKSTNQGTSWNSWAWLSMGSRYELYSPSLTIAEGVEDVLLCAFQIKDTKDSSWSIQVCRRPLDLSMGFHDMFSYAGERENPCVWTDSHENSNWKVFLLTQAGPENNEQIHFYLSEDRWSFTHSKRIYGDYSSDPLMNPHGCYIDGTVFVTCYDRSHDRRILILSNKGNLKGNFYKLTSFDIRDPKGWTRSARVGAVKGSNSKIHLMVVYNDSTPGGNDDIYYAYSQDSGNTWVKDLSLAGTNYYEYTPYIYANPNGNQWHVVYREGSSIKYKSCYIPHYVWSSPIAVSDPLSNPNDNCYSPCISSFPNSGKFYVAWDKNYNIYFDKYVYTSTPTITVTSPNGGESWTAGSKNNIKWTSSGNVGKVRIHFSKNNGSSWSTIVSSTPNDGSYNWTLPNINSNKCLVRVRETDGSPSDRSNSVFSIVSGGSGTPKIKLNRAKLLFGADTFGNSTSPQQVLISNGGTGTLNWSVTVNKSWLSCSPGAGTNSGVVNISVNPIGLPAGTYSGTATFSAAGASNSPRTVPVTLKAYKGGQTSVPFGDFATPASGAKVRSSFPVTGWVLDDIGVTSVKIYNGSSYVGDAVFVEGVRSDVEQAYPGYPQNSRAGWGYMLLSNFLPNGGNGTYTIRVKAFDAEGHQVVLGSKTIFIDNAHAVKPFGAIDTPDQGGIASGNSFINWGWVLTPQPNKIPFNGSTIKVYVDGVYLGHPTYNLYRADIASLFPGYQNTNGAAAKFIINTKNYKNGVHTIQWTANDNAGNQDGIGSRYFSIQNIGTTNFTTSSMGKYFQEIDPDYLKQISIGDMEPIQFIKGWEENQEPVMMFPDENGIYTITLKEMERIEFLLSDHASEISGFMEVGAELRLLPVGSSINMVKGTFNWIPAPGFLGDYALVFIIKLPNEEITMKKIYIIVVPKYGTKEN